MTTHNMPRRAGERGFTLIELSIVLVIIGLLVGGILKGQELINSTQLKTQIAQVDGLRAAVNTFQDKYFGLPGDIGNTQNILPPGQGNVRDGNGNGLIGVPRNSLRQNIPRGANAENSQALVHLLRANLVAGIQPPANNQPSILPAKVSGAGVAFASFTIAPGNVINGMRIGGGDGYRNAGALTALDASELDRKYDDGQPGTGDMMALGTGGSSCVTAEGENGEYTNSDAVNCMVVFSLR